MQSTEASRSWRSVSGPFDIGESRIFRYLFFFLVYFGFSLPLGFFAFVYMSWGVAEHGTNKYLATMMFTIVTIPFFLRPVWSLPVDRMTGSRFGRRRPWVVGGTVLHLAIIGSLLLVNPFDNPVLWPLIAMVAMVPRVFAEQAIGGMMVEIIPDPGRVSGAINLAFRLGNLFGSAVNVYFVWGSNSWFLVDGVLNESAAMRMSFAVIALFLLVAVGISLLLVEGRARRGPLAAIDRMENVESGEHVVLDAQLLHEQEQAVLASVVGEEALEEATEDREKAWPEDTPLRTRLAAAFNTRTSVLCLFAALLLPLGDGFESWGRFWLIEHHGWSGSKLADWQLWFVVVGFFGLIGPMVSDFVDRRRLLMGTAGALIASYLFDSLLMLLGAPDVLFIMAWSISLILSDWLIFIFLALVVEIADARMGATHLGIYTSLQAISSTFLMVWLAAAVLYASDYWVLFGLAALGPTAGLFMFRAMRIPPRHGEQVAEDGPGGADGGRVDAWDVDAATVEWRGRVAGLAGAVGLSAIGPDAPPTRMRWALSGGGLVVGLLLLLALWPVKMDVETVSTWSSASWGSADNDSAGAEVLGEGETLTVEIIAEDGGLTGCLVQWNVQQATGSFAVTPQVSVTVTAPAAVNWTGGANATTWTSTDTSGETTCTLDGVPLEIFVVAEGDESEADALAASRPPDADGWAHGVGVWTVEITITADGDPTNLPQQPTFSVEGNLRITTSTAPTLDDFVDHEDRVKKRKPVGIAVGFVLSTPLVLLTSSLGWLVGRPVV